MLKYTLAFEGAFRPLTVREAKNPETTKTESLVTTVIRK